MGRWEYGKALEFNGANYVKVPITDTLQLVETFTVEFWVQRGAAQPATWNYMVAGGAAVSYLDKLASTWGRTKEF